MDFAEAERLFRELKEDHRQGRINAEALEAEASRIRVQDAVGREWMLGVQSGSWYVLDENGEWTAGDPYAVDQPGAQCLQCGRTVEAGRGLCDRCLEEAISETEPDRIVAATRDVDEPPQPYTAGVLRLALTVLVLVVVCAVLFALQMAGARLTEPSAALRPATSPIAAATDSEPWPPALLPTATARPETQTPAPATQTPTPQPATAALLPTATPAGFVSTQSETPTMGPETRLEGRLLYPGFDGEDGTYNLYERAADGSGTEREIVRRASQACVSSRGEMAYRSWDDSSRGLMVAPGGDKPARRVVAYSEAARPSWSPNGEQFLFFSLQESDRKSRIYRSQTDGVFAVVTRGSETVFGDGPAYLPDGRFVFRGCIEGRCGLYVMGFAAEGPLLLVEDATASAAQPSPDGSQIAFMSQVDGDWELSLVGSDGQGLMRITHAQGIDGLPEWSPDGQTLAYVSYGKQEWTIRVVRPDGTGDRALFKLDRPVDGRVRSAQEYESRGWIDERICWVR